MSKRLLAVVLVIFALAGCGKRPDTTVQRNVVIDITVTWADGHQRHYTSQEKMRAVLLYIRTVSSPFDAPEPPQEGNGQRVTITTTLANKTQKTYQQQADRFFREGNGPWRIIDKEKGEKLWMLLKLLPSDP